MQQNALGLKTQETTAKSLASVLRLKINSCKNASWVNGSSSFGLIYVSSDQK